jgi:hypothetical protein
MAFPLTKPGGAGVEDTFTSGQFNDFDRKTSLATDCRKNPDGLPGMNFTYFPGFLTESSADHQVRDFAWDPTSKRFLLLTVSGPGTDAIEVRSFIQNVGATNVHAIHASIIFDGGSDNDAQNIVIADGAGAILVGNVVDGWAVATTPPGVATGRPVYAWETDRWYVMGTNKGFFSTDGGDVWTGSTTDPVDHVSTEDLATDGTRVVAATEDEINWSDDGITWTHTQLPTAPVLTKLAYNADTQTWVAVGGPGVTLSVYHSTDGAESWSEVAQLAMPASTTPIAIGFVSGILLIVTASTLVWGSDDQGLTAALVSNVVYTGPDRALRIFTNPFQPNMLLNTDRTDLGLIRTLRTSLD